MARSQDGNDRVRAASDYFLANVVPEALGLSAAAEAGAAQLYSIAAEALA